VTARKNEHYLVFLKDPDSIRKSFSTTNAVEAAEQLGSFLDDNGSVTDGFLASLAASFAHSWNAASRPRGFYAFIAIRADVNRMVTFSRKGRVWCPSCGGRCHSVAPSLTRLSSRCCSVCSTARVTCMLHAEVRPF
jgi:hypothetical protein